MSDSAATNRRLLRLTIAGAVLMTLAGSAMHFVYDWSGQSTVVGLFGPVNESIWEHAKLVFWPPLLWYGFIALSLRRTHSLELTGAAALALWFMPVFQTAFYYFYAAITRGDLFLMDLVDFELTVILGQLLFYRLAIHMHCTTAGRIAAIVSVAALAGTFFALTFQPPHLPVFRDPQNGTYGLPR
ncbi:MAG: DUF6512 family protein [Candidatus Cryosericum sp.]